MLACHFVCPLLLSFDEAVFLSSRLNSNSKAMKSSPRIGNNARKSIICLVPPRPSACVLETTELIYIPFQMVPCYKSHETDTHYIYHKM